VKQTSLDALEKIAPKVGTIRRKVYEAILLKGLSGMTDYEIEKQLNLEGNTVRPIRGSLVDIGLVIDSGTTRPNAKGNQCIVWRTGENGMML
jgi:transcription initiation factor IIE alpha subunit